jgi:SAM-dependent methyltransferase
MNAGREGWKSIHSGERSFPRGARPAVIHAAAARYRFAVPLCAGREVLDIGCGCGAGLCIISGVASRAVGLDYSSETLVANRETLRQAGLYPVAGDGSALPFHTASFGAVTAFEVIEHCLNPEGLLAEVRRVLVASGVFILSTPNRPVYSPRGTWLDYHAREYDARELVALLGVYFPAVTLFGQAHLSKDAQLDLNPLNRIFYPVKRALDPRGVIINRLRAAYVYLRWGERPGDCSEEQFPVLSLDIESLPVLVAVCGEWSPVVQNRMGGSA